MSTGFGTKCSKIMEQMQAKNESEIQLNLQAKFANLSLKAASYRLSGVVRLSLGSQN